MLLLLLLCLAGATCLRAQAHRIPNDTFIFLSDTQAPLFVETFIHKTPHNRIATRMIFNDILDKRPAQVFLLGDVVAAGSRPKQWTAVDRFLDSIRGWGGEAWACLGNHEYLYQGRRGVQAFQQRFPKHSATGYYVLRDSVAVILLNSNFSKLSASAQAQQVSFYKTALDALDRNDSVSSIIVACHHAPYSNSKVVGSNLQVREQFAKPFLKSRKARLFLSGHSHNFEHFRIEDKTFLVIGGGGGIGQLLNTGPDRIACEDEDCHPLFHYLMVKRLPRALLVICREVSPDLKGFNDILSFKVPTP